MSFNAISNNLRSLFTFEYYKEGFTNWTTISRIWWALGLFIILSFGVLGEGSALNYIATLGGVMGFTCVMTIHNRKRINGLLGLISAILIAYVAIRSGNPADAVMQFGYIVFLNIPLLLFGSAWASDEVKSMDKQGWLIVIVGFTAVFTALYFMDANIFESKRPFIDALAGTIGFVGAFLMLAKYRFQYIFWISQSVVSIALWGITASQGDANWVLFITYCLYLGNSIIAVFWSPWSKNNK